MNFLIKLCKIGKTGLILGIFVFLPWIGIAQFPSHDLLGDKKKVTIPFEYKKGFIVVKLILEEIFVLDFIFDTGAQETTLLNKFYADILDLDMSEEIKVLGSDMKTFLPGKVVRSANLALDKGEGFRQDIIVMESNYIPFEEMIGHNIDGILGASFMSGSVVEIDYKRHQLTFYQPDEFEEPKRHFSKTPIEVIGFRPFLQTPISIFQGDTTKVQLLMDTGASIHILINQDTNEKLALPNTIMQGYLGSGLGGDLGGYIGRINYFEFVGTDYQDILIYFQESDTLTNSQYVFRRRNGILGNLLFENHRVIIDFAKQNIYVSHEKIKRKKFKFNKSGMTVFAVGAEHDQFLINDVRKGSVAYDAGIQNGDLILKINGIPRIFTTLERINRILSGPDDKLVKMIVKRNGKRYKYTFRLGLKVVERPS